MAGEGASNPYVSSQAAPPIFVDTSLGTHVALVVSPEETVADFKRKVCIEHAAGFPSFGDVSVLSLKVRRRAIYYHLSDSMLVKTAFNGIRGTWFLQMDMAPVTDSGKKLSTDGINLEVNTHQHSTSLPIQNAEHRIQQSVLVSPPEPECMRDSEGGGDPGKKSASEVLNSQLEHSHALIPSSSARPTVIPPVDSRDEISRERSSLDGEVLNDVLCEGESLQNEDEAVGKRLDAETEARLIIPNNDEISGDVQCEGEELKNEDGAAGKRLNTETETGMRHRCDGEILADAQFKEDELQKGESKIGNQLDVDSDILQGQLSKDSANEDKMKSGNSTVTRLEAGEGIPIDVHSEGQELQNEDRDIGSQSSLIFEGQPCKDDPGKEKMKSGDSRITEDPYNEKKRKHKQHKSAHKTRGIDQLGILGELCSQLLHDDSPSLQDPQVEKKKKKRKGRKEGDELHTEIDLPHSSRAGSELEPSKLELGKKDFLSKDAALKNNPSQITVESINEKESKDVVTNDHLDFASDVTLSRGRKKSKHEDKKVKTHNPSGSVASKNPEKKFEAQGGTNMCEAPKVGALMQVKHDASNEGNTLISVESEPIKPDSSILHTEMDPPCSSKIGSELELSKMELGKKDFFSKEEALQNNPSHITVESINEKDIKDLLHNDHMDLDSDATLSKGRKKSKRKDKKVKTLNPSGSEAAKDSEKEIEAQEGKNMDEASKVVSLMQSERGASNHSKMLNAIGNEPLKSDPSILQPETVTVEQTAAVFPSTKASGKTSKHSKKKSSKVEPSVSDSSHLIENFVVHSNVLSVKDMSNATDAMKQTLSRKDDEMESDRRNSVRKSKRLSSKKPAGTPQKNDKSEEISETGHFLKQNTSAIDHMKKKDSNTRSEKSAVRQESIDDVKRKLARSFEQEKTTLPAPSSDTTEDESFQNNGHYRISVRKAPVKKSNKVIKKSDQEDIFHNTCDDTFGNFSSSSSDDQLEANNNKSLNAKGGTNQTMVIRGPKSPKLAAHSGGSISTAETSGDEIDQSKASNTSKKRIALSVLLRGSHSYRKAKLNVSASQADDVDFVPETQPES
ncbi:uncharacterized protein LOC144716011 isoform X2 [Wolffia australiana]